MQNQGSGEVCSVCNKSVQGYFDIHEEMTGDKVIISVMRTPDSDFNVCDACSEVVHFDCSRYPETGYCDRCFLKYQPADPEASLGGAL